MTLLVVLSMLLFIIHFCDSMWSFGVEANLFCVFFYLFVLVLEIELSKEEIRDHINQFNSVTLFCFSQSRFNTVTLFCLSQSRFNTVTLFCLYQSRFNTVTLVCLSQSRFNTVTLFCLYQSRFNSVTLLCLSQSRIYNIKCRGLLCVQWFDILFILVNVLTITVLLFFSVFFYIVKPLLTGHLWDKVKVTL